MARKITKETAKELHALPGGTPAPCRPLCFLLLVQFPNPLVNFFPAQSPLFIVCHRFSSCLGFCVCIACQKAKEKTQAEARVDQ